MTAFDEIAMVSECRDALGKDDMAERMVEIVRRYCSRESGVDARFPEGSFAFLEWSPELMIFQGCGPVGVWSPIHNHNLWAVVGVFRGTESNVFYRRDGDTLRETHTHDIHAGEAIYLDEDVIHKAGNVQSVPNGWLNVYGGDLVNRPRSRWDEQTLTEHSYLTGPRTRETLRQWLATRDRHATVA